MRKHESNKNNNSESFANQSVGICNTGIWKKICPSFNLFAIAVTIEYDNNENTRSIYRRNFVNLSIKIKLILLVSGGSVASEPMLLKVKPKILC